MNVLVSGGTGFIGKELLKKLENHKILALSRKEIKNFHNVEYFKCDLNNPKSYQKKIIKFKPQILVHLAWQDLPNYNSQSSFQNLLNTKNFLEFINQIKSCKKIIMAGSCFEADNLGKKIDEDSIRKQINFFSIAKNFLKDWSINFFKDSDIKIAWIRIFFVYGEGQRSKSLIPSLVKAKKAKKKIKILTPNDKCDFIYIDDVVRFFIKIINNRFNSGVFNIGSGTPTKVIKICKKILGKDFKKLCIYKSKSKILNYYWADMKKSKMIEKKFKPISIDEGINKIMRFYNA